MLKEMKRKTIKFIKCNKGSAIASVLIVSIFLSILGSILVFMSYTSFQTRVAARYGQETFYDTETEFATLYSAFQEIASATLEMGYTNIMENYNVYQAEAILLAGDGSLDSKMRFLLKKEMHEILLNEIYYEVGVGVVPSTKGTGTQLVAEEKNSAGTISALKVNGTILQDILDSDDTALPIEGTVIVYNEPTILDVSRAVSVLEDTAAISNYDTDVNWNIVIEDLAITYVEEIRGIDYTSTIFTDINITIPPVDTVVEYSFGDGKRIVDSAYVAVGDLVVASNQDAIVGGRSYSGGIDMNASSKLETSLGAEIITGGDIEFGNYAEFKVTEDSAFWGRNVNMKNPESILTIDSKGVVNVADDLSTGFRSAVTILGQYYGFGDSDTVASESSGILVNGYDVTFDIGNAERLTLAGTTFVNAGGTEASPVDVLMGESFSVKSNQLAYLAEARDLVSGDPTAIEISSNPQLFDTNAANTAALTGAQITAEARTRVLWTNSVGAPKTLADYGVTLKPVITALTADKSIANFYLEFPTTESATEYFKDYFYANTADVKQYYDGYLNYNSVVDENTFQAGSAVITYNGSDYSTGEGANVGRVLNMQELYKGLSSTLSTAQLPGNPYENIIVTDELNTLLAGSSGTVEFKDELGNVVGLAVNGDYSLNASKPSTLKVVVATGDVTVSTDFQGLIMAGGNLTINGSYTLTPDPVETEKALLSEQTTNAAALEVLVEYFGGSASLDDSLAGEEWDSDRLVTYSNWQKFNGEPGSGA